MRFWIILSVWFIIVSNGHAGQAAVAMPDRYAALVAQQVLNQGGHAVDAAVAASMVLAVTYPEAGNLGGGGFMLIRDDQQHYFLDYRETAPAKAHRDVYLNEQGAVIPRQSLIGVQAAGIPGTVAGLWEAHQRFGRLPWAELMKPAITLAEQGFDVPKDLADLASWYQGWLGDKASQVNFAQYFGAMRAGQTFKQPKLAATLTRLAQQGVDDFYRGETAGYLLAQAGAWFSAEDLAHYRVRWREPLIGEWRGHQVISAPPPSSGGVALLQLLALQAIRAADFKGLKHNSTDYWHLLAEYMKPVYADRAHHLGDPDFHAVPVPKLLNPDYLASRALAIHPQRISATESIKAGFSESEQTTHFSIVDAQGNAVANTTTLNMPFGNGVVVEGAGFLLNNEMDDFSAKPGVPNVFGVIGGEANAIAPGKRMLSSMTPTILVKDQQLVGVVGTPGGSTIITSVFQTLLNSLVWGMSAQAAVDAPRMHHQLWPKDEIGFHPSIDEATREGLELMGYQVKRRQFQGDVQWIYHHPQQGLQAASDRRGRGVSLVWTIMPPEAKP